MTQTQTRDVRYHDFSIELDAPPMATRPNALIGGVLEGTGLKVTDFETSNPVFGHQTWVLKAGDAERDALFTASKPVFKERITRLYERGSIRYGTW